MADKETLDRLLKAREPKPKKVYKGIAKKSAKKIAQEAVEKAQRESNGGTELEKWYAAIMERETPKCWETDEWIGKPDKQNIIDDHPEMSDEEIEVAFKKAQFAWHGSIAHILPKSDYPSVATHPQNYMILKMWGGIHGTYDASWEKAAKMKVWKYAVKIINILYPLLTAEEKGRLMEIEVIAQEIRPDVINGGKK